MYTRRAGHRVSAVPGGGRGRPAGMYYRAVWNAAGTVPRHVQTCTQLYQLQGNPTLLHRCRDPGRQRADCRWAIPAREIPRPAGDSCLVDGSEDGRRERVGIRGLRPAMSGLGAVGADDPAAGAASRLAKT